MGCPPLESTNGQRQDTEGVSGAVLSHEAEAKRHLLSHQQRHRYNPLYVRRFGPAAGLLLSQLEYWQDGDKGHSPDGWIYKSIMQWQEETGLTRHHVKRALQTLTVAGVISREKRKGVPPRYYHTINYVRLLESLQEPPAEKKRRADGKFAKSGSLSSRSREVTDKIACGARDARSGPAEIYGRFELPDARQDVRPDAWRDVVPEVRQDDQPEAWRDVHRLPSQTTPEKTFIDPALQAGAEPAVAEPAPPHDGQIDREVKGGSDGADQLSIRPTVTAFEGVPSDRKPATLDGRRKSQVLRLMEPLEDDPENPISMLATQELRRGAVAGARPHAVAQIAEKVREELGAGEPLEAYESTVADVLELMGHEDAMV
jgi:hypothetical protein